MAKTTKTDANWTTVDVDTMHPELLEAYKSYKAAYAEMKRIREGFEHAFADQVKVPAGQRVVFGYNFGKLSVAVVADDRKPAAKAGTQSLADWIATQRDSGRNS